MGRASRLPSVPSVVFVSTARHPAARAPAPALNRAFAGSKTPEALAVMERIAEADVLAVIVYSCAGNNPGETSTDSRAAADGVIPLAQRVLARWAALVRPRALEAWHTRQAG